KLKVLVVKPLDLKPIFDGKTLEGWKRIDRPNTSEDKGPKWRVESRSIVATSGPGVLEDEKENYGDVVLQIDVRPRARQANGGAFCRSVPGDFMQGYEAQVYNRCIDGDVTKPVVWATGGVKAGQTGHNPPRLFSRDFRTYRMTLIARGPHVATWINGCQGIDF